MPVDFEDVETDSSDGENKVFEGESSVDLDYKSNIVLAKNALKLSVSENNSQEKAQKELEDLIAKISLKEENGEEIVTRAPIGGIPVMPENCISGTKTKNDLLYFTCNSFDGKPKRSYNESEIQTAKYKKPTEHSLLQMQCSTMPEFMNQNVIENTHHTSGGIMTVNFNSLITSNEEYDSSFSPGESNCGSSPGYVQVVSPSSDYSSMASPDNEAYLETNLDQNNFKEGFSEDYLLDIDETKLKDLIEIIDKERVKEKLEEALKADDFQTTSPSQNVSQQGSLQSSSEYNSVLNELVGNLLNAETNLSSEHNQSQFSSQLPPVTTLTQAQHPVMVNSNLQFTQQQQLLSEIVTTSSSLQYNLQTPQSNAFNKAIIQHYSGPQIISTTGHQPEYVSNPQIYSQSQQPVQTSTTRNQPQYISNPQIYSQSQQPVQTSTTRNQPQYISNPQIYSQPVQTSSFLGYNQQNSSVTTRFPNQHFASQQAQVIPNNSKQSQVAFKTISSNPQQNSSQTQVTSQPHYLVQQQSQVISTTSNQQNFNLAQHQTIASPKQPYTTSPPPQQLTSSPGHVTNAVQATQPSVQQLTPVLQKLPSHPTVITPQNPALPGKPASEQDGITTPVTSSNKAVIIVTQPTNSSNSIMLVPTTNSQVIYIPQIPVAAKNKARSTPRVILPKPANIDANLKQADFTKISTQTGKGRRERDTLTQQCESPGQRNLNVARRCVASMKEQDLESTDQEGDNYLHVAVCKTDVYMVQALLDRLIRSNKLDMINKQNNARQTPLYLAVSDNQPAMVHMLIRYGADVNIKGMTRGYKTERVERAPVHCAASLGKEYSDTLKELFRSEKIDPDILNSDGLSALHCAIIEHGKLVVPSLNHHVTKLDNCQNVALLLKFKANPNLQDRCSGKTPLMYAIESKDYSMVETLLKGVESYKIPELLKTRTFDGRTCMKIADGLRNEFDPHTWQKLHNFLSSVN